MSVMDRVTRWFQETEAGQAIARQAVQSEEAQRLDLRKQVVAELAGAEAALRADREAFDVARAAAQAEVSEAQRALEHARDRLRRLVHEYRVAQAPLQERITRARNVLRDTVSPQLAGFVEDLRQEPRRAITARDAVSRVMIDGKRRTIWHNNESVTKRLEVAQALIKACGEAGTLMFEALSEEELAARLEAMRATLPEIERRPAEYAEVPA